MKAPDKIYLQVCGDCPQTDCVTCKFDDLEGVTWNKDRIFPKDVEYTRTDAFIEKAISWLKEQNEMIGVSFQKDFLERFQKYMKRE